MSTEANQMEAGLVVWVEPGDVLIPEETNVRPWTSKRSDTEVELEKLEQLGQSMATVGQLEPIVVTENTTGKGPKYVLIAGRRRTRAAKMFNLGHEEQLKLQAIIKHVTQDKQRNVVMYKSALHENVQREDLNPMDFAENIKLIRGKMGKKGEGAPGTKNVAEFFQVSPATIIQYEKLLSLPEDLQSLVAAGELSNDAAFELVKVKPDQRKEVMESAKQHQTKELEANTDKDEGAEEPRKPKRKARASKTVKAKHVRTAIRETTGVATKRQRAEVLEFFRGQLGPTNGHPNGTIHQFCEGFLSWAEGKLSDKALNALWDKMVEKSPRGTAQQSAAGASGTPKGAAGRPAPKKQAKRKPKK